MKVIRMLVLTAGLTLGGVSAADAASCRVVVTTVGTVTGGATGGVIGFVIDLGSGPANKGEWTKFGVSVGMGVGGAATRGLAEYLCPNPPRRGVGYDELDLRETLTDCLDASWKPFNPFWNRRDFCTVPRNPFVAGDDVSMITGRQLDQRDIIGQLQVFYQKLAKHSRLVKDFAGNLRQCRRSYDVNWRRDTCYVTPTELTSKYWKARAGQKVRRSVGSVLQATVKTLKARSVLEASAKFYSGRT